MNNNVSVRTLTSLDGFEHTTRPLPQPELWPEDAFAYKGVTPQPWISEYTYSYGHPQEWQSRVLTGSLVHTGSGTRVGHWTHHTGADPYSGTPHVPPGTIKDGLTISLRYQAASDPAVEETKQVCELLFPQLAALKESCANYHTYAQDEGWITTGGFLAAARRAGLQLSRAEFLALERAVPKDIRGNFNYRHIIALIEQLGAGN